MIEDASQSFVYRDKIIKVFLGDKGGFYASIGPIAAVDEAESYISRSETAEEALRAAKAAIDAQSLILV